MNLTHEVGGSNPEIKITLGEILPKVIASYEHVLREDEARLKPTDELAESAKSELEEHLAEITTLKEFLTELAGNPKAFQIRVQQISQDDGTYTASLKRKDDPAFGEGRHHAQTQLRFYVQESLEAEGEAIKADSLKGMDPQEVLRRMGKRGWLGNITVNTVLIYRGVTGRTMIEPHAGIRVLLRPDQIEVYGLTYEGNTPHFTDQGELAPPPGLDIGGYGALAQYVKALAGYKPR